jgi:SagB-type dehydrogenase family enzyme
LEQSLQERRSKREFTAIDLDWETMSQLLWSGQGITENTWGFRTAPSAGGLYPLTIYVCRADGIYEYIPAGHQIKMIADDDRRLALSQASLAQNFIAQAPACLIITVNAKKVRPKYGGRADRYLYIEAGHIAENVLLQSTSLGLASVPVGAFWDDIAKRVLSLPDDQDPVYLIPVGYPK